MNHDAPDISPSDPQTRTPVSLESVDWAETPLGDPAQWPQPLRTVLDIIFGSTQPMFIVWGPERTLIYNDGYAEILGGKHPGALGRGFFEVWPELVDDVEPLMDRTCQGEAITMRDLRVQLRRGRGVEEAHFSFSFTPVHDGGGEVSGIFCALMETTRQVFAQRALQEDHRRIETQLAAILEQLPVGVGVIDRDGRTALSNPVLRRFVGPILPSRDPQQAARWSATDDKGRPLPAEMWPGARALRGERVSPGMELLHTGDDGSESWLEVSAVPLRIEGDEIAGAILVAQDVTQRRRTHDALRESEALYRTIAANLPGGAVFLFDRDLRYVLADGRALTRAGFRPADLEGRAIHEALNDETVRRYEPHLRRALEGIPFQFEHADHGCYFITEGVPIRGADGQVKTVLAISYDITERRRAEEALQEREEAFRTLTNAMPQLVWTANADGMVDYYNEKQQQYRELPRTTVGVYDWQPLLHPDDIGRTIEAWSESLRTGADYRVEHRVQMGDGSFRWHLSRAIALRDDDGRIVKWFGTATDIDDLKEAERQLAESEQALRDALQEAEKQRRLLDTVLDSLPVGVIIADAQGRIVRDNEATRELWGIPPQTDSWEKYGDWVGFWPETGQRIQAHEWAMARAILQGESTRNELIQNERFDTHERRYYINNAVPLRDAGGRIIGGVAAMQDVTDRLDIEEALRRSEQNFRALADHMSQLAWMADADGWVFWYNRRWFDYTGTTLEQMQGWGWRQVHHPDHVERVVEKIRRCFQAGELWEDLFPLRSRDGEYRWFLSRAAPIRDSDGNVIRWFGTNTDVTEQKQSQEALQQAREQLEQRVAERTAELQRRADQLARLSSELTLAEQRERRRLAQVLHDHLQQLLVGAKFGLEMLSRRVDESLQEPARQIDELIDESLKASRSLTVELSPPILHDAGLAAGLEWLSRWMEQKHGLTVHLTSDHRAATDREDVRVLLFQSVRELLLNTVKHAGVTEAHVSLEACDHDMLCVTVQDNGRGFDPQNILQDSRALHGGFGLFSIRERLGLLGGRLDVISSPGRGARFSLVAPMREAQEPELAAAANEPALFPEALAPVEEPEEGQIRLLLADDHAVMRQGLRSLLAEEDDIAVIGEAADGVEAVELAHRLHPDVVLMDFSMPRMDGVEATRRLHQEMPEVKVIGLSMYQESDRSAAMMDAGAAAYLSKSGKSDVLLQTIRRVSGSAN